MFRLRQTNPHQPKTNQNYGLFKPVFWSNLETLSQVRFDIDRVLIIPDFPILVVDSVGCGYTEFVVEDSFLWGFSVEYNARYWKKYGDVTPTRSALLSNYI